jgi:hypothetical protein
MYRIPRPSFGGARRFTSDGWQKGKVIFEKMSMPIPPMSAALPPAQSRQERLTFEHQDGDNVKDEL